MKKQMKISAIGDGTTIGAIHSLNSNLAVTTNNTVVNILKPFSMYSYNGVGFTLNDDGSIHANGTTLEKGQVRYSMPPMSFETDCIVGISLKNNISNSTGWKIWSEEMNTNMWNGYIIKAGKHSGYWFLYKYCEKDEVIDLDIYVWIEPGNKLHDFVPYTGDSGKLNSDVSANTRMIGNTDISSIGDGTVTNAISVLDTRIAALENSTV